MTRAKIEAAQTEAKRFLERAAALLTADEAYLEDKKINTWRFDRPLNDLGSKYTGAVRRASLDLTRALAEMRKP